MPATNSSYISSISYISGLIVLYFSPVFCRFLLYSPIFLRILPYKVFHHMNFCFLVFLVITFCWISQKIALKTLIISTASTTYPLDNYLLVWLSAHPWFSEVRSGTFSRFCAISSLLLGHYMFGNYDASLSDLRAYLNFHEFSWFFRKDNTMHSL